jgi:hypothetical protein
MNRTVVRIAASIIFAGVAGTLANTAALALVLGPDRLSLALVPGRYAVAIALCIALPFLDRWLRRPWFWCVAIIWLTVAPSVLAKLVFGTGTGWTAVLAFNLVYALTALGTYSLIVRGREADRN